ncbi:MAG: Fe-S cluster assembly protein HesB [Microbacteriaceae bacterium]|nr:Fe-S cluster assembly protein HesB [Microbacteriaceae bacterium]
MTLTLTDKASTVVKAISTQSTDPESGGLRIAVEGDAADFSISVVPAAEPSDTLVENDGARVFLDPSAAEALSEAVLDADVEDDGAVRFSVGTAA